MLKRKKLLNVFLVLMGGFGIDRVIISLWVLWKYNVLELVNMYFIGYKYKLYSNVKEIVGKEIFCYLYVSKYSVVLGKGCRKFS